jgi:glyoxylase-like metal-dependent hydrolase (beta-lactamase superfamily II)
MTGSARQRKWLIGGLTIAIMALALIVTYQLHFAKEGSPPSAARVPRLEPSAITIAPGIHLLGGLSPAAAYAVETSEGLILVDSGLEADAASLKAQLAKLGLDWRRVRAILLTHVHGDHCGGAQYLREATGAKVYAGRGDAAILRAGSPPEAFQSNFFVPNATAHATTVDIELEGNQTLEIDGVRFQVLATPGHSPGSICYLMERDNLRVLFSGDVIMSLMGTQGSSLKHTRPLGTYVTYLPSRYRGSAQAFLASLRNLRALPAPDLVLPGHPRLDPEPQSPSMRQERWQALLDDGIRDMEKLLARYERDGAGFLDGVPKRLLPDLYYLGDYEGAALYGFWASSKFFVVDAPGGPALIDVLNSRLRQLGVQPAAPTAVLLTSCGPEATVGLKELVEKSRPLVIASAAGLDRVKALCPAGTIVLPAADLPGKGWFEVKPIPLRGRGPGSVAYQVRLADKTVLFSGRIPLKLNQSVAEEFLRYVAEEPGNSHDYFLSLDQLGELKPDLWLPAIPTDGQNANLYDREWQDIILSNRRLLP